METTTAEREKEPALEYVLKKEPAWVGAGLGVGVGVGVGLGSGLGLGLGLA